MFCDAESGLVERGGHLVRPGLLSGLFLSQPWCLHVLQSSSTFGYPPPSSPQTPILTQIYGRYPFDVKDKQYAQKFQHAVYLLPPEIPASDACKDLLTRLLVADPDKRISLQGILGHPWFLETLPSGALNMNDHYLQKTPNLTTEVGAFSLLVDLGM